jgi:hypothetical protein
VDGGKKRERKDKNGKNRFKSFRMDVFLASATLSLVLNTFLFIFILLGGADFLFDFKNMQTM